MRVGVFAFLVTLASVAPAWAQDPNAACPDIPWLVKYGQHLVQQRDRLEEEVVKLMVEVARLKAPTPQPKQETPK